MNEVLNEDFILELITCCLRKKEVLEVVAEHLQYHYIPDPNLKELWKHIVTTYRVRKIVPSVGGLMQKFKNNDDILEIVHQIKTIHIPDQDGVLFGFEDFIKKNKFVELFDSTAEIYSKGDHEKAYKLWTKGTEEFSRFSLKAKTIDRIFKGFKKRNTERIIEASRNQVEAISLMVDELDRATNGGGQRGEAVLFLGESGVGKSFLLTSLGVNAARRKLPVAHFQLEGKRKQCLDRYDSCWTGSLYVDVKSANIEEKRIRTGNIIIRDIGKGDVYVVCPERFNAMTIPELRKYIIELKKTTDIAVVIVDYLELLEVGDGYHYKPSEERFRQQKLGRALKDIAVEFDVLLITATQASSIDPVLLKDPDFVMTRWNLSEDKGKIRPFDLFVTLNQTPDEKKQKILRMFIDKAREHYYSKVIFIAQELSRSRFYDKKRTLNELLDMGDE